MKCRICQTPIGNPFASSRLMNCVVKYFDCATCGYVQTEEPTWLGKAYASPINLSDTGIMARNLSNVSLVLATITLLRNREACVVDCAGGHGFLVRLLRDVGIDALWADPHSENLVARGFEYSGGGAGLVTAFEAFEHFVNPVHEMQKLVEMSPNILLTTNLIASPAPKPSDWWYYGLDHGQHIGFYRLCTLHYLASKFSLHLISDGVSTHLFSAKKYNNVIWRTLVRLSRRMPQLFTVGLKSKIWSDHKEVHQQLSKTAQD